MLVLHKIPDYGLNELDFKSNFLISKKILRNQKYII